MSDDPTIEPTGDPVIDALLGQREAAAPERRRRTGGHAAAGERSRLPPQRPWAQPRLRYAPTEVVSADELESIHLASLRVLEEIGMDFLDAEARDAAEGRRRRRREPGTRARPLRPRHGPRADRQTAPASFTLHATNPAHDLVIGGDWMAFGSVASAPNVDGPRPRPAGRQPRRLPGPHPAVRRCSTSSTSSRATRSSRSTSTRRSATSTRIYDLLTLADKPIHAYSLGRQRNPRRDRDGPHRARHRRRDARPRAVDLHGHQLELAAPARHADAPGHPRDVGAQPGHRDDAVHARRARWRR